MSHVLPRHKGYKTDEDCQALYFQEKETIIKKQISIIIAVGISALKNSLMRWQDEEKLEGEGRMLDQMVLEGRKVSLQKWHLSWECETSSIWKPGTGHFDQKEQQGQKIRE